MIKKHARFYLEIIKFSLNLKMVYRLNFWLGCFSDITYYTAHLLVFFAIFNNVNSLNGWNSYQVMFFLGFFFFIDSIAMVTFFFGVYSIPENIRTGRLDLFITKPVNTLFYVAMSKFEVSFALNVLYGVVLMVYSACMLNIHITIYKVLGFLLLFILMFMLYFTILLMVNSASFWLVRTDSLHGLHNELLNFTYRMPGVMYRGVWKIIFMGILPYGLIATIPAQFMTSGLGAADWLLAAGVVIAYWILGQIIWKIGLKRYNSASS